MQMPINSLQRICFHKYQALNLTDRMTQGWFDQISGLADKRVTLELKNMDCMFYSVKAPSGWV